MGYQFEGMLVVDSGGGRERPEKRVSDGREGGRTVNEVLTIFSSER